MKLNIEKIIRKFNEIDEALEQLKKLKSLTREEFINNIDYRYIAYAAFIILTEAVIDICFHISAKKLKKAPTEYAECFDILKKSGLINEEIADTLKSMARFRNFLIHRYGKVDFSKIYKYISNKLFVIEQFKEIVKSIFEEEKRMRN